mmetsp:Transcript_25382/g.44244  ORF Transcript_25382/g.44244 Transcript_25382/m.44244 type:complete len:295 (-) Transcript_25382:39-923(-)
MSRLKTLFVKNLPDDITSETLDSMFKSYGTIIEISIPKDRLTGKIRNFAFIQYTKEESVREAIKALSGFTLNGNELYVSYALDRIQRQQPRRSRSRSSSRNSRSHSPTYTEAELRHKFESLMAANRDLQSKHMNMLNELEEIGRRLQKQKEDNATIDRVLQAHVSGSMTFLPCGHKKQLKLQDNVLIDELYEIGLARLSEAERNDERMTRKLRSLIFYKVAAKLPEVYRCTVEEKWVFGECGHIGTAKCFEVREIERGGPKLRCKQMVDKQLACGHIGKVECANSSCHIICKQC